MFFIPSRKRICPRCKKKVSAVKYLDHMADHLADSFATWIRIQKFRESKENKTMNVHQSDLKIGNIYKHNDREGQFNFLFEVLQVPFFELNRGWRTKLRFISGTLIGSTDPAFLDDFNNHRYFITLEREAIMEPFKVGDQVYDIIAALYGKVVEVRTYIGVRFFNPTEMPTLYFANGKRAALDKFRCLYHLGEPAVTFAIPTKPKKKVKAYKWVCKDSTGDFFVSQDYYRDDRANLALNHPVQRIDEAFIEVDE